MKKLLTLIITLFCIGCSGDSPQSLIDETVKMVEKSKDLEKRWEALLENMSDEEKAEWERKQQEALIEALDMGGMTPK